MDSSAGDMGGRGTGTNCCAEHWEHTGTLPRTGWRAQGSLPAQLPALWHRQSLGQAPQSLRVGAGSTRECPHIPDPLCLHPQVPGAAVLLRGGRLPVLRGCVPDPQQAGEGDQAGPADKGRAREGEAGREFHKEPGVQSVTMEGGIVLHSGEVKPCGSAHSRAGQGGGLQ